MRDQATPMDLWRGGMELSQLLVETQMVIAYRMMGMAGLWAVAKTENRRMVDEKGPAFTEATMAATQAALAGHRPDEVLGAWMRPLRHKTRSNVARLGKRGPRLL